MALVDFYQLAVLYNLSRRDGGVLSNCSHPPPMPPANPDQPGSFLPCSTQYMFKTPERKRNAARSLPVPDTTPMSHGTSTILKLEPDTDEAQKYDSAKYEQYIAQDFERHRVFVDIDAFMENVLHVPKNWKKLWGPTINYIKHNEKFSSPHRKYTSKCGARGLLEQQLYEPLVEMGNAILDLSESPIADESVKARTPQRYLRNDPKQVFGGVMNNLKPDVVAVHHDFLHNLGPGEMAEQRLKGTNLSWAQPLQVLEVKPCDNALVDGSYMPRLKVGGESTTTSLSGGSV